MSDFKAGYDNITALCDYADELLSTVEHDSIADKQNHLDLIEPLINEVADSSDILAEEFLLVAESKKSRSAGKFSKKRIESALRRIFVTLNEYNENTKKLAKNIQETTTGILSPIIQKIQGLLDKVVSIFFEFAQISLQSIMNKAELDALKTRDSNIALMMHRYSISQHS